ncbi:MAG: hypothetical protein HKN12_00720 [Gemmatimonadetes bacterium]|nr:hypothetical protein [Gemmatimonadota bacterium]
MLNRFPRRTRSLLVAVALVATGCGVGETLPGSGMIDGMDLGMELGLDLRDLEVAPLQPDPVLLDRIAELSDYRGEGIRLYDAATTLGDDDVPLQIAVAKLPIGGILAVALDEAGVVRATGLWGAAVFDTNRNGGWETFCRQFQDRAQVLVTAETLGPADVDRYWADLAADPSPDAALTRTLYRHRRLMTANGQFVRATMRLTARGDAPPHDWFRRWKRNFQDVASLSGSLADVIGPLASEQHRILAEEAAVQLDAVLVAVRTREPRDVRQMVSGPFYRATCTACHVTPSDRLGGEEIHDGLRSRMQELGVRRDVMRVGFDLWGVPNEDRTSQTVANAFKAIFLVAGERPV